MCTIKIYQDTRAPNPYTDWDMVGTLVTKNRLLGGEGFDTAGQTGNSFRDFCIWLYNNGHVKYTSDWLDYPDDYTDNQYKRAICGLERWVTQNIVYQPVYMSDHVGCSWDSGLIGYIFKPYTEIREEWSVTRVSSKMLKQIENLLKAEIENIDTWLTGQVYGVVIEDEDGDHVDSLWGIYDPTPEHIQEMFPNIVKADIIQALENVKAL